LIWKSSTTVGFGIKGKFVVAWICEVEGSLPDDTPETYGENVKENCIIDGRNSCFNNVNKDYANKIREWHESGVVSLNNDRAAALQLLLDEFAPGATDQDFEVAETIADAPEG